MPTPLASELPTPLLYPLSEFYNAAGLPAPHPTIVKPAEIPEPYRSLLVHRNLMTSTLEAAFSQRLRLKPVCLMRRSNVLLRQVLLVSEASEEVFEMGAVCIDVSGFPDACQRSILEGYEPLGSIVRRNSLAFRCDPCAYFRLPKDDFLSVTFSRSLPDILFGRRVLLSISAGRKVADVVELLPTLEASAE